MRTYRVFAKEGHFMEKFETQLDAEFYSDNHEGSTIEVCLPINTDLTFKDFEYMAELIYEIKMLFLFSFDMAGSCAISENSCLKAINYLEAAYLELKAAELNQVEAMVRR